eukprot:gnl/Chilomastix_caulleri/1421.p1 GENE.gnl/Chilomastix_caulleri/1421~~gnl/Chilomastix_caulleri/1421.p1  ORF type:complete len:166 (+),score=26.20 gnl/Chilomastix_caulleri/1421:77-574(+)
MIIVIQRVLEGKVEAKEEGSEAWTVSGEIKNGIVALLGISEDDFDEDANYIVKKTSTIKLWDGIDGTSWRRTMKDIGGKLLLISQFTLLGKVVKGKPDFHNAMKHERAREFFDRIVGMFKKELGNENVATGVFGAEMKVSLVNDGPCTITISSRTEDSNEERQFE